MTIKEIKGKMPEGLWEKTPMPTNQIEALQIYEAAWEGAVETQDWYWYAKKHWAHSWGSRAMEVAREILMVGQKETLPPLEEASTAPYPEAGAAQGACFVTRWSRGPAEGVSKEGVRFSDHPWTGFRSGGVHWYVFLPSGKKVHIFCSNWKDILPKEKEAIPA